ncbi:hypothetical protein AB0M95_09545 [Sphaerisporangium sp. NPDC051017]|uniref:hypothetical protein n=1 Tax=Sphaerisporangium sp. NPDC051017 TaxID=3154636 RepID=UPI0034407A81
MPRRPGGHQVNALFGVAHTFAALARVPGVVDRDLSHLRSVVVAREPRCLPR